MTMKEGKGNYVYLLECGDGTLYAGWTTDLSRRVLAHNRGKGAKYTRGRGPVKLRYYERYAQKEDALRREWELKQMSRKEKWDLIATFSNPVGEN